MNVQIVIHKHAQDSITFAKDNNSTNIQFKDIKLVTMLIKESLLVKIINDFKKVMN